MVRFVLPSLPICPVLASYWSSCWPHYAFSSENLDLVKISAARLTRPRAASSPIALLLSSPISLPLFLSSSPNPLPESTLSSTNPLPRSSPPPSALRSSSSPLLSRWARGRRCGRVGWRGLHGCAGSPRRQGSGASSCCRRRCRLGAGCTRITRCWSSGSGSGGWTSAAAQSASHLGSGAIGGAIWWWRRGSGLGGASTSLPPCATTGQPRWRFGGAAGARHGAGRRRRTTSWGCGGHARARPSTFFVGLLPHSRMHHGVGDGPLMNAEQHALRLRASSARGLTPRLCHTKQGWIWCIQVIFPAALLSVVQIYIKSRLKMRAFGKGSWPSWFPQIWIQGLERKKKENDR